MSAELLLSIEKKTDNFVERTKTNSQETLELKKNTSGQTYSFGIPMSIQKKVWLLALTNLEFL